MTYIYGSCTCFDCGEEYEWGSDAHYEACKPDGRREERARAFDRRRKLRAILDKILEQFSNELERLGDD